MVLFLFIIMLLDLTAMEHAPRQKIWMACTLVIALAFLALVARTLTYTPAELNLPLVANSPDTGGPARLTPQPNPDGTTTLREITQTEWDRQDDTHRIGRLLFRTKLAPGQTSYVAPFEITSLLILVATVGVIVLCKQDERPRPRTYEEIVREAPPIEPKKETALKM
jgi:NADH:ubiquinone oxidoreductase subunit 6 (subunit J)